MARSTITRGELATAIEASGHGAGNPLAGDPLAHADFVDQRSLTIDLILRRVEQETTPREPVRYSWPKDDLSLRAMTHLDPLDEHLYRALIGRFLRQIRARLHPNRVLAAKARQTRPFWTLEGHGSAIRQRSEMSMGWLDSGDVACMVALDVEDFFYTVKAAIVAASLDPVVAPEVTKQYLYRWLVRVARDSGVPGLPVGHDASKVLANHLLVVADEALEIGVRWLRYMDDTWIFADSEDQGIASWQAHDRAVTDRLRLRLNGDKSALLDLDEARDKVKSEAIEYLQGPQNEDEAEFFDEFRDYDGELLDYALEDPVNRKRELRRAITLHRKRGDFRPLRALQDDPNLLGLAPDHWSRLLDAHVAQTKNREIEWDWIRESALTTRSEFDDAERLVFLPAVQRSRCDEATGTALHELAMRTETAPPVAARAALAWEGSDRARLHDAIDGALDGGHYSVRRAFIPAVCRRSAPEAVVRKILDRDPELEPTVRWALAT